jgi:hypothetical protein
MKEITGDLFAQKADALCITTNGVVKKDGACVMGRGCALTAKAKWPQIEYVLGSLLTKHGNHCYVLLRVDQTDIVSFPTKNDWKIDSKLPLIQQSCQELVGLADIHGWCNIVLPRPGCGNGGLQWKDIKPVLEKYLDDRFSVISY